MIVTLREPLRSQIPDDAERWRWLEPLSRYVGVVEGEPQALDYAYTSIILEGSLIFFPKPQSMQNAIRRIVQHWCFSGSAPSLRRNPYTLQQLYATELNHYMTKLVRSRLLDRLDTRNCAVAAFCYLVERFCSDAQLSYRFEKTANRLEIYLLECPFCLGQLDYCSVFRQLMAAFQRWVQVTLAAQVLELNLRASSGHQILIDII